MRGVSSVGVIDEALIALRMQLSEKFEDKHSFLYNLSCNPPFKQSAMYLTPEASRRAVDYFVIPVLP